MLAIYYFTSKKHKQTIIIITNNLDCQVSQKYYNQCLCETIFCQEYQMNWPEIIGSKVAVESTTKTHVVLRSCNI